jgi:hypothetical protein
MEMMNPEVKAAWVAALRSGEYRQGQGGLRAGDEFCCLGVLCDLKGDDWIAGHNNDEVYGYSLRGVFDMPPASVYSWAGCNLAAAKVTIDGVTKPVADHNDEGATFAEIADAIEAQL